MYDGRERKQPVKKNETMQSTSFKQDMSFQNNETNSNNKNQQIPTTVGRHNNEKILTSNFNREFYNFKEYSESISGDGCEFAFGAAKYADSKDKTKLCQNYWSFGYCAYGPYCRFTHYEVTKGEVFSKKLVESYFCL